MLKEIIIELNSIILIPDIIFKININLGNYLKLIIAIILILVYQKVYLLKKMQN